MTGPNPATWPDRIDALLSARPASFPRPAPGGRLLRIDGPSGAGKTTLADRVAAHRDRDTTIVHMDDLYDGWSGLDAVVGQLGAVLEPLGRGEPGRYRRYDWGRAEYAETVTVDPSALLILEGVGSGDAAFDRFGGVLVWIDMPAEQGLQRALDRDGAAMRGQLLAWQRAESDHFARDRTRRRADLLLDGTAVVSPPPNAEQDTTGPTARDAE